MTREAIEYFKFYRKIFCENHLKICPKDSIAYQATLKEKEFYDLAIKALEQEPTENDLGVDCIDRQATLDAIIKRLGIRNESYLLQAERVLYQQIKDMPSVIPQLSSELEKNSKKLEKDFGELDCISRIETIDYLCKHCPDDGECFKDCDEIKHLRQMPSVTPQEPAIDRVRAEIDSLEWWCNGEDYFVNRKAVDCILDKYKAESEE